MNRSKLNIQLFADGTPQPGDLTYLYVSTTLGGEKTQIADVQNIPSLVQPRNAVEYDALDYEQARQRKGTRPVATATINVYYTEEQHKALKAMADSTDDYWFFVRYPDSTKGEENDPLVQYFKAQIDLSNAEITKGNMIQDIITFYISEDVQESYGFPNASI